jgi:4-oxalocrotonate tautomerase
MLVKVFLDNRLAKVLTPPIPGDQVRPFVHIKIIREGVAPEQKARLIAGVTRLLQETLGKNPAATVVVTDEVDIDNRGLGGKTLTVRRKRGL